MNPGELLALLIVLAVFGTGTAALTLVLDVLFPQFIRRARGTAERMPIRSGIVGLINLAFFSILSLAILSIAQEAEGGGSGGAAVLLRLLGGIIITVLVAFIAFGIAAVARWIGERIAPGASAARQSLGGIAALELASLAPVVGWFLVLPLVVLVGYGAVIIAMVWRRGG
jgi:hypothetical protein